MDGDAPVCCRCGKPADIHVTEFVGGAFREVHYCEEHARSNSVRVPIKRVTPWTDDDRHATLEVTREQLEAGEVLLARFGDGTEVRLPNYEPTPEWKVIEITPEDTSREAPRFLRVRLASGS